jgi:predicted nucleic acid-binding protein
LFAYAFDADEPVKQGQAHELLDRLVRQPLQSVLLWQVAGELLSCLRKWESAGRITSADVEANFRDVFAMFPLCLPHPDVFEISFDMKSRFSLSHWDSMLLAACKKTGVNVLYTEDLDPGADYDGITIVNPFA